MKKGDDRIIIMQKDKNKPEADERGYHKQNPPVKPEKEIPGKPDPNPDPTKPKPGGNEPEKNDPTRIEEPQKIDPTRIDEPPLPKPEPGKNNTSTIYNLSSVWM